MVCFCPDGTCKNCNLLPVGWKVAVPGTPISDLPHRPQNQIKCDLPQNRPQTQPVKDRSICRKVFQQIIAFPLPPPLPGICEHHIARQSFVNDFYDFHDYLFEVCTSIAVNCTIMHIAQAISLHRNGRSSEADAICREILAANPSHAEACQLLGTIAHEKGHQEDAIGLMQRAISLSPNIVAWRVNLAALLGKAGKADEALPHLAAALRLKGNIPELHNNMGATLEALDRLPEAVDAFRKAILLRPGYAEPHYNLANALKRMGKVEQAVSSYREAIRLRHDYAKAYAGLSSALMDLAQLDEALQCLRKAMELQPKNPGAHSSYLYSAHYHPDQSAQMLFEEHVEWGRRHADPIRARLLPHQNDRGTDRRLRVGYFSPDFREQTVPRFIGAALTNHDHDRFEIFCYSDVKKPDAVTERLSKLPDHWRDVRGKSDPQLEQIIRDDAIDILIDLRGHASGNRMMLFARKPAPIQVNMVGYFDTTGLRSIDYRVTDEQQDPPGAEQFHVEQLIRIRPSCWCYSAEEDDPPVAPTPALSKRYITFASLNKVVKVSAPCAKLWARVLDAIPGSRLLLPAAEGDSSGIVRGTLARMGLPPDRLDLVGKTRTRRAYLERFGQIDIALDTFPFNGITTTCDGLWMGVPLVSLSGGTTVSRAGRSILSAVGLAQLATDKPDEFVRTCIDLASDIRRLNDLRLGLRQRMADSPLMDHRGFARQLEAAYIQAWTNWCSGPPGRD